MRLNFENLDRSRPSRNNQSGNLTPKVGIKMRAPVNEVKTVFQNMGQVPNNSGVGAINVEVGKGLESSSYGHRFCTGNVVDVSGCESRRYFGKALIFSANYGPSGIRIRGRFEANAEASVKIAVLE